MFDHLKSRLKAILAAITGEDAKIAAELLESAATKQDVEYVLTESGIGEIPTELLTPTPKTTTKVIKVRERRSAPRTGTEARRRRKIEPISSSIIVVRKSGRYRAAS